MEVMSSSHFSGDLPIFIPYGHPICSFDPLKKGPALPLQRVHEGSGRGLCISFRKGEILPGGEEGGAWHRI